MGKFVNNTDEFFKYCEENEVEFIDFRFTDAVAAKITDVYGRQLRSVQITPGTSVLNLHDLSDGTYFLVVNSEEGRLIKKFVIRK